MGTIKRFDHRMSPAHARLRGLASEMPRPSIAPPSKPHQGLGSPDRSTLLSSQGEHAFASGYGEEDGQARELDANGGAQSQDGLSWQSAIATMHHRASTGEMKMHAVPRKAPIGGKWSKEEDDKLKEIVQENGPKNWKRVAELLGTTRTDVQCLHRWNKVLKPGLLKGPWTAEEDEVVTKMVLEHGVGNIKWSVIAGELPGRIGKQCRERWFNHLDPSIKRGEWTMEEDKILFEAQRVCGNRWCEIAKLLPGRTENAVKNRFNSSARKRWLKDNGMEDSSEALMLDANRVCPKNALSILFSSLSKLSSDGCTDGTRTHAPHRTAPHRTAPHRTAPHRTASHRVSYMHTSSFFKTEIARLVREIVDANDARQASTEDEGDESGPGMMAPLDKVRYFS